MTSLLPGTVPCAEEDGALVYHCLDIGQPVLEELAEEERRLTQARETTRDG
jgi:multicomponent Na+:H+ antiporter subunit E